MLRENFNKASKRRNFLEISLYHRGAPFPKKILLKNRQLYHREAPFLYHQEAPFLYHRTAPPPLIVTFKNRDYSSLRLAPF